MTAPDTLSCPITLQPIGFVRSPFHSPQGMPIQTVEAANVPGQLELLAHYQPGLRDIEGFELLMLITHLHQAVEKLEVVPFMDDHSHGVFATRAPARPNWLGLSIVHLERVQQGCLHFTGNDMLDGTPVLDIKPYVPALDVRHTERIGWFQHGLQRLPTAQSDDRMR
ncbi:tRNA (N6-threonylcarbamoyladenosine(37)-N6)-methyltransferase TrmO [Comamonas sp. CMM03]|uniref:tRNA (N6-threonylcarbamoyladenosine(37)-N6)-methyltransferase TrmO n=1 Tax=Comamonas sp. CMM03 TaxID=2854781 RepID=UPI001C43CCF3|nr:tRNA (N6-threonylcarbamoyladenosine(37)-N6)-methyltransferase TrmO [Comamonas sp. CMM03]MBV7417757.1 tRNA (N6-threonylcarbamoyladenosine(37)-N6)-methyltransferase TrmO [Comamonas sp. CMM03]